MNVFLFILNHLCEIGGWVGGLGGFQSQSQGQSQPWLFKVIWGKLNLPQKAKLRVNKLVIL